jgi:polyphosphate kinase 2 (PPK2 family)
MPSDRDERIADFVEPFRVEPGSKVSLAKDFDPALKSGVSSKKQGKDLLTRGIDLLAEYQSRLYAQDTDGVLIVLQALDAAGKDGTIRHVMSGVNPQGVSVHSFKVRSSEELDHDYFSRYAQRLPRRGEIGIFNRSYYEEVLVVRVHPEALDRQKLPKDSSTEWAPWYVIPADRKWYARTAAGFSGLVDLRIARVDVNQGVGDQENMAFMHTPVTHGSGVMIVTSVGGQTEVGKIRHAVGD